MSPMHPLPIGWSIPPESDFILTFCAELAFRLLLFAPPCVRALLFLQVSLYYSELFPA